MAKFAAKGWEVEMWTDQIQVSSGPFPTYISGMRHARATHADGRWMDLTAEQVEELRAASSFESVEMILDRLAML
jgi:hypothetical protein